MTDSLRIGIAGLGTVGAEVFRLVESQAALLAARAGRALKVTAVSARDKKRDRALNLNGVTWHDKPVALADDPNVDVIVELMGGAEGAPLDLIRRALENGKPVVTANKALLSQKAGELLPLTARTPLFYEAAVAGGIPVIKGLREGLAANSINAVYGILNGTCNFILSEMTATGGDFGAILKQAQDKGYAEADPAFDIDGVDAAHKLSILSGLAFGGLPNLAAVETRGIRDIQAVDISFARELGYRVKLLGVARRTPQGIVQSVEPCLVPETAAIAHIGGAENAVYIDGDAAGKILLTGAGAGGRPTASAVMADIIDIARGHKTPLMGTGAPAPLQTASTAARRGAYYIRLIVLDQPGVIADVSAILRDCNVSLESVLQRSRAPGQPVPVILTSHATPENGLRAAAEKIAALKSVTSPPHVMRIETFGAEA